MVLGGAMVYTLLLAQGKSVGQSLVEPDLLDQAQSFIQTAEALGKTLYLPQDHVVVTDFNDPSTARTGPDILDGQTGVDIGPQSIEQIKSLISQSKMVLVLDGMKMEPKNVNTISKMEKKMVFGLTGIEMEPSGEKHITKMENQMVFGLNGIEME